MNKQDKFELEQQSGEELYRKGMVAEALETVKNNLPLFEDADMESLIAMMEVELRERHDARERDVQEYADNLPF